MLAWQSIEQTEIEPTGVVMRSNIPEGLHRHIAPASLLS